MAMTLWTRLRLRWHRRELVASVRERLAHPTLYFREDDELVAMVRDEVLRQIPIVLAPKIAGLLNAEILHPSTNARVEDGHAVGET